MTTMYGKEAGGLGCEERGAAAITHQGRANAGGGGATHRESLQIAQQPRQVGIRPAAEQRNLNKDIFRFVRCQFTAQVPARMCGELLAIRLPPDGRCPGSNPTHVASEAGKWTLNRQAQNHENHGGLRSDLAARKLHSVYNKNFKRINSTILQLWADVPTNAFRELNNI